MLVAHKLHLKLIARYENLILDTGEDGSSVNLISCDPVGGCLALSSSDGALTPPNSAGGSLPSSVTTDANGVAVFNLNYLKQYATWIDVRVRAKAFVQGTEATSEIIFNLRPSKDDMKGCLLPGSPFLIEG